MAYKNNNKINYLFISNIYLFIGVFIKFHNTFALLNE